MTGTANSLAWTAVSLASHSRCVATGCQLRPYRIVVYADGRTPEAYCPIHFGYFYEAQTGQPLKES